MVANTYSGAHLHATPTSKDWYHGQVKRNTTTPWEMELQKLNSWPIVAGAKDLRAYVTGQFVFGHHVTMEVLQSTRQGAWLYRLHWLTSLRLEKCRFFAFTFFWIAR